MSSRAAAWGDVYLGRQTGLDREVAVKELSAFHAADPSVALRFLAESRIAGSLSHPNIVGVIDYVEEDGVPYIAMEYVEHGSLRPRMRSLTLAQIVGVLEAVLAALDHAHGRGIVHRDLKPENLMIGAEGKVKVADFGIAKALHGGPTLRSLTATGLTVGTPACMAPEQAMGLDVSAQTDLYSVGVIAYELLAGRFRSPIATRRGQSFTATSTTAPAAPRRAVDARPAPGALG